MTILQIVEFTMVFGAGIVAGICYCQWKEQKEYKKWQDDQPQIPAWLRPQAD